MFRKLAATVAVSAALISPSSWSLGLGDIDADSGLNQPLKAEITLLSSRNVSEEDLRAKLASYESYNKFGVQLEAYHNSLNFRIITKNDGSKAIVVESREPIKEPFVNFLLELNWAQGRLMREYTLLLDPPVFAKTTPAPQPTSAPVTQRRTSTPQTPQVSQPKQVRTQPEPEASTTAKASQPEVNEQTRELASTPEFSGDDWTVERGQTLWSIAKSVRPEGVSVQQTLMAIFHNNPEAFINNDINRMKAGAVLTVPERSAISDVSQSAAVNTIRSSTVSDEAPLDVRKSVDETDIEDSESSGGRLSIGSVDEGSSQDAGGSTLDDDMSSDLAETESQDINVGSETGDSTSEFGTELTESETATDDGLSVEDETLSVLSGAADAADETDEVTANDPAVDVAENTLDSTAQVTADSSNTNDNSEQDVAKQEEKTKPAPVNSLESNSSKAFYEADNFWLYAGGGLALLLLIGGGLIYRRSSKEVEDDGGLLGMMTAANEAKPKKKRESFIGDNGMAAPKEKVDPISSADILIARGKLSEAEGVLEDALAADPHNQEVRVKLMEVVASQQDLEKFQQLKNELPDDFDHDSSLGLKVASLTSLITPDEDTLQVESGSEELSLPSEDDIFGNDDDKEPVDLDLSAELESVEDSGIEKVNDEDDALDLDLGDFDKQVEKSSSQTKSEVADDGSIEFTTDQDDEDLVTHEDDSSTNDSADMNYGDDAGSGLSADDAATKFDLAKAYMELGDDDAAKDILEEIKSEGNAEQRAEADKLLAKL